MPTIFLSILLLLMMIPLRFTWLCAGFKPPLSGPAGLELHDVRCKRSTRRRGRRVTRNPESQIVEGNERKRSM